MTTKRAMNGRWGTLGILVVGLLAAFSTSALAQTPADPNPGNITLTAGIDFPGTYVFRGIVQELDPGFTAQPYGDVGLALFSGTGGVKSVGVNFGVWNSLQTGSAGLDGPQEKMHYEEDFYSSFTLGFGGATSVATTYIAYTSPNGMFGTVHELNFKVAAANRFAPYGVLAFELSGQADGGSNEGTYLELGVGPNWPLGKATLTVPVKLGMSLNDYYELNGEDNKFGFFDVGALLTLPLTGIPSNFGTWNIHGGVDFLKLGDSTKMSFDGDDTKIVPSIGFGLSY